MKVSTKKERNTDKDVIHGKMALNTKENGMRTESMVKESIPGTMEESMKVIGKTTTWTVMVSILGKMAESMKDSTKKTRNMVWVSTPGPTAVSMMVNGRMVVNTAKENTYQNKASTEKASGKMESVQDGWMKMTLISHEPLRK